MAAGRCGHRRERGHPDRQIRVGRPTRVRGPIRRPIASTPSLRRRPNELYWPWIAATATYGVGEVVSTVAFLRYVPTTEEADPVVRFALESLGLSGLVALKVAVSLVML